MVLCPDCGRDVPKARFCKNCGAYIANIKEERNEQLVDAPSEESKQAMVPTQQPKKVKFCFNCGNEIDANFKFCPECGQDLSGNVVKASVSSSNDKNILIAIILSVFLPGLGQIYLGLDHKGAIFLIAYVVSAILILLLIGFLLCAVIWIWALIDTIISTNALNRGENVEDKLF
jgi:TM2 domain-containing membrane protein YozV/RNA polymerase subunit RPABC4/transcription elongation factor Spt4